MYYQKPAKSREVGKRVVVSSSTYSEKENKWIRQKHQQINFQELLMNRRNRGFVEEIFGFICGPKRMNLGELYIYIYIY